jgi:pyruvate carboxylase subunit B
MVSERGAVIAPMPGKIVLLRVKAGDSVRLGDPLCVLEAMKMENEITSPKNGIVKEVKVAEGAAVNIGEIILTVSET